MTMYLKRLDLHGFKTFATSTGFQFDDGVTAIVGPNGVGKSNIADAVRWVLGEQRYSVLRGKRTEDMIFAGTGRRARMGMAEAVLTFDNTSQWLPIDFSEVTVGRRVYRSGENRYLINGSRVRLRDVVELVGKAGLGRYGLVTIGQGVADAALSLRPDERRVLFEEAAGIRVYQEKRLDALSKLAETQQNLLRLTDILAEIRPRLRDLERQAHRTEEHQLLSRDLEKLLRLWYGFRWQSLQARLIEAEAALRHRLSDAELGRARMHEMEALLADTQARQADLRRQLSIWHQRSSDLHSQAESTGRELAVSRERWSLLRERWTELQAELAGLQERRADLQDTLSTTRAEGQRLQVEAQTLQARLGELRQSWQGADGARVAAEQAVEAERDQLFRLSTALSEARNRSRQLEERHIQVEGEREVAQADLREVEEQLPALETELSELRDRSEEVQRRQEAAVARRNELEERLAALELEKAQREDKLEQATRQAQRLQDRQQVLQGLRNSLEGYTPGARAVLNAGKRLPGIVGPVVQMLRAPKELERAVEAALGPYAQALVVERWEDVQEAIQHLQEEGAGPATFLPLDSLAAPKRGKPPTGEGVLGLGLELIECDARYEEAARLLLGQVVVVQDLDTARGLRRELHPGQRLVTLSGEVVHSTGVVSGGAAYASGGLLAQEREWRDLPGLQSRAAAEQRAAQEALQEAKQQQEACRRELAEALREPKRLAEELTELQRKLIESRGRLGRIQSEVEWRSRLDEQLEGQLSALEDEAATVQREAAEREQEHEQRKAALDGLLAQLQRTRRDEESTREALAEAETALAVAQRQSKVQAQLQSSQEGNLSRLEEEIAAKSERAEEAGRESEALDRRIQELQAAADAVSTQITELTAQIEPAEAEVLAAGRQGTGLERDLARARQRLSELEVLYNQQVLDKERRNDELQALEGRIEEELGDIEYPSERVRQLRLEFFRRERDVLAPPQMLPENIGAEIKELKGRLRRLGSINPSAPTEYQEVRQRYEFLQSQMADLEHSADSLQQVIAELDEVMKAEFLSVFSAAAEEFSLYFEALFGGGQAKLILTEPNDPATTGVDIVARPPGKRQQSLALLSGGERALTATALLFAILKARPLPFCLLDEVDAMLDEANVGRFRALLEEFAAKTQFIVITHNRHTIEAADTIYGISMGDNGVSQAVSLRLEGEEVRI
jgi:chromosome segregation protein